MGVGKRRDGVGQVGVRRNECELAGVRLDEDHVRLSHAPDDVPARLVRKHGGTPASKAGRIGYGQSGGVRPTTTRELFQPVPM